MCVREDPACTSFARPPTVIPEPHAAATMDKQIVVRKKHIVAKQIELSASDSDDSDYVATPDAVARGSESDDGSSDLSSNEYYEIEKLLDQRTNPITGVVEYLVKWEGYSNDENTWEPEPRLIEDDNEELIKEWRQAQIGRAHV